MLTCKDVNAFIIDYLEDDLDNRLRHRFEKHLEQCAVCNTYFDQYRQTIALAKEAGEAAPKPPSEIADVTLDFLRQYLDAEKNADKPSSSDA